MRNWLRRLKKILVINVNANNIKLIAELCNLNILQKKKVA